MPFTIDSIEFEGPITKPEMLENRSGVFVLLEAIKAETQVVDFGFAKDLKSELTTSMRETKLCKGLLKVGFKYLNSASDAEPIVERLEHWYDNTNSCNVVIDQEIDETAVAEAT